MAIEISNSEIVNKIELKKKCATVPNDNQDEVEFDDLLSSAGEFGKYQLLLFLSTFPFYVYGAFVYYGQMFITEESQDHWCWIPELAKLTDIERKSLAIPGDENSRYGYSKCFAYDANWTELLITGGKPNGTWATTACQNGWEFNKTEIPYPTISSEMGWVCERNSYQATAQSIFFSGSVCGGLVIGWIADRYGRLPAAVISNIFGCIGGIVSIFATNFLEFAICRFFMGLAYDNCMMMVYLLVLEYVAPKYRTLISNVSFAVFYALATTVLPWIALACGHWKIFSLVTSIPLALAIFAPLIIPESPRWLLSKGRTEEAIKKIVTIGRINKCVVPEKLIENFKVSAANNKEEKESILELIKRPLLRRMLICICIDYMCCNIVFDGLVRSIGQLDFNFFVSFSAISFTEFPSLLLVAFVMDWLGRRWLTFIVLMISCLFCFLTVFIGGGIASVMCAVVARFSVNMAYNAAIQWAAEMLPISVRGTGASVVHICGYIATIISPYIVYLENYIYWLPLVMIGLIAFLGAVVSLTLPETAKKDLPITFDDSEQLIRNQRFFDMPFIKRNRTREDGHVNDSFEM